MQGAEVLTKFTADSSQMNNATKDIKKEIGNISKKMATVFVASVGAASTAMTGLLTSSIKAFAAVEQSIGGVETLFKNSADTVIANSKKAYTTAGIDANTYMEQVTSFSASLLQSLEGDTTKAAEVADMAIIDMADNANKMGTSIESIQNAYQGFAKQNYTMLDNLKLGYGGTKEEMQRLLSDAKEITGVKYDIKNLNDVYTAIHVIQQELDITGTTSKEASTTILGSVSSAKAAFQNFIAGTGGVEEVVNTFITAGTNISNAIIKMLPQITEGITKIINGLIPLLPQFMKALFPGIVQGGVLLLNAIIEMTPQIIEVLANMLPSIIQALVNGFILVINTLAEQAPVLIPIVIDAILQTIPILIDNLPLFVKAGAQLLGGILAGIINSVPSLLGRVAQIGVSLVGAWKKINLVDIGKNMIKGLWNGLSKMKDWVINKVKDMGKSILSGLKKVLGINSPSKQFAIVGKYSAEGYVEGLDGMQKEIDKSVSATFNPFTNGSIGSMTTPTPTANVTIHNSMEMDSLGQLVNSVKTFSGGAKNDYNYVGGY